MCAGESLHAEVVHFDFNKELVKFDDLVYFFLRVHDPTTLNRQGNDVGKLIMILTISGTQYRSTIFYHTDEHREIAEKVIKQVEDERRYKSKCFRR